MNAHASLVLASCVLLSAAACGSRDAPIAGAVPGIDARHQRAISRQQFGFQWPLSVGVGVLACDAEGAILFRTQQTTYQLSGTPGRGADPRSLRVPDVSGPPSNPLRRIKQDDRMRAFESVSRCPSPPDGDRCIEATLQRFGLSRDDWTLIEAEGKERRWPPLTRDLMPLDPLVAAGRELCAK